jgi:hypothetical protein
MKLKNNSVGPKMIYYINNEGARKSVELESNGIIEINDCSEILNKIEIENAWVSIVDEKISDSEKLAKATKDVESYMSESEEKKSSKKK